MRTMLSDTLTTGNRIVTLDSSKFERNLFTVVCAGTWGAAAQVDVEVSPDGTNWGTLRDLEGNDITMTASKALSFRCFAPNIRLNLTNGDGGTSVNVALYH